MNKSELSPRVAAAASMSRTEADTAVSAVFSAIADALAAGETVAIAGFGTFSTKERSARTGRKPKHRDELFVLAATARPVIPVLNYSAHPDAHPDRWRSVCADESVHTTVEFDAVVCDNEDERRLLDRVKALDTVKASVPDLDAAIERWKVLRERERQQMILAATDVAAEFLVTAAAAVVVTEPKKRNKTERRVVVEAETARFLCELWQREIVTRKRIVGAFGFRGNEAQALEFDVEQALGGVDFLSRANLLQHVKIVGAAAAGAAVGAGAGATVDISVGGLSLGGVTVVGGALGAARWLRGQEVLQLRETGVELLAARSVATIRAMLARGHAARTDEPVSIEAAMKESLESDTDPAWRASWKKGTWAGRLERSFPTAPERCRRIRPRRDCQESGGRLRSRNRAHQCRRVTLKRWISLPPGSTKKCVAIRRHIPIGRIPTEFQATRRSTEDVASVRLSEEIVRAINTHKRRVQSASASPPIGLSTAPEPVIRRAVFATDALECAAP